MTLPRKRVVIITGAGSEHGIGFAAARLLGALGMRVVLTSTTGRIFDRVDELRAAGIEAEGVVADLTQQSGVDAVVARAESAFGGADVLVNNAGMTSMSDPDAPGAIDELSTVLWHASLERNLTTSFLMIRAVVKGMRAAGYGRIVNVSSVSGPVAAYAGDVAYHAAKAGVVGLTRAVAIETASVGITVNAVHRGGSTRRQRQTASAPWVRRRPSAAPALRRTSPTRSPFWPGTARPTSPAVDHCRRSELHQRRARSLRPRTNGDRHDLRRKHLRLRLLRGGATVSAPIVPTELAERWAEEAFGLVVHAVDLRSQQDANFLLVDTTGAVDAADGAPVAVMKIPNSAFDSDTVEDQDRAAQWVADSAAGLRASTRVGDLAFLEAPSGSHIVRLIRFLDGGTLHGS